MITITVTAAEKSTVNEFKKFLDEEITRNPNFNGESYKIVEGDFFCVDAIDEINGSILYRALCDIIDTESGG